MVVRFQCPSCSYEAAVPDEYKGTSLKCPQCAATAVAGADNGSTATKPCPFCAEPVRGAARKCRHCGEILDRGLAIAKQQDRLREIEKRQSMLLAEVPGSRAAFICGVLSILSSPGMLIGILLGGVAVLLGAAALKEAPRYPGLQGAKRAQTAIKLGVAGIVASVVVTAMLLPSISRNLRHPDRIERSAPQEKD